MNKLSKNCFAIRTISHELGYQTARLAYFALMESHLRYGIPFWGCSSQESLSSAFVMQKRAVRYMCGAGSRDPCKPLFVKHEILTVICLYLLEISCVIFKNKNTFSPNQIILLNTRSDESNIYLPRPNSQLIKNSIFYNGKKIFNKLPISLKKLVNINTFRKTLRSFLIAKAYYSVQEFFDDGTSQFTLCILEPYSIFSPLSNTVLILMYDRCKCLSWA